MASPSTRAGLVEYGKRQLGFPVLEINIADAVSYTHLTLPTNREV